MPRFRQFVMIELVIALRHPASLSPLKNQLFLRASEINNVSMCHSPDDRVINVCSASPRQRAGSIGVFNSFRLRKMGAPRAR